jgi:Skp family chaperone for outer membrane proteins
MLRFKFFLTIFFLSILTQQIGVIDLNYIIANSKAGRELQKFSQEAEKSFAEFRESLEDPLKKESEEIQKLSATLSKEALAKRIETFKNKRSKAEQDISQKAKELETQILNRRKQFLALVKSAGEKISESKNIAILLDSSSVVYFSPNLNVSDEVIKIIDASSNSKK